MIEDERSLGEEFKELANEYAGYLEDFRRRLIMCGVFFIAAFTAGFFASPAIIQTLVTLLALQGVAYVVNSPFEILSFSVNIGLTFAIFAAFPLVLVELYEFVRPALDAREHRLMARFALASIVLFVVGFLYGMAIMYYASWAIASLNLKLGLVNLWNLQEFISFMLITSALLGLLFQGPLVVSALIEFGVVSREFFVQKRRLVIAIVIIIVALLPPTDGLSLIVMAVPLIGLYELTLALSRAPKGKPALLDAAFG